GDRVPRARFKKPRRAGMLNWSAVRADRRARPEHAELAFNLVVGNSRVVRHAARGGPAQLLEDFTRTCEGEAALPAKGPGDVLQDLPVLLRVARRGHGRIDLDDPALGRADRALVLLVLRAGQHHVGEAGGFTQEEIDAGEEFELLEHAADEVAIG